MNITQNEIDEMRRCAKRELELRKRVYPKWVATNKMPQEKADFEIETMKKICDYFDYLQIHTPPEQQKLL